MASLLFINSFISDNVYYVFRRILFFIPVLAGVTIITFTMTCLVPGDPALMTAGSQATPEVVERIREKLGLDEPLPVRYFSYMAQLLKGDFGISLHSHRPVLRDLKEYLPATLELTLCSSSVALLSAIFLGVYSAAAKNRRFDCLARIFALSGVAMPSYWLGLMLLMLCYGVWHILPGGGRICATMSPPATITGLYTIDSFLTGDLTLLQDSLRHLILPSLTQAGSMLGILFRVTRAAMQDALRQEYMMTAYAKGVTQRRALYKHALKNALIPLCTIFGICFGSALGGSLFVESVFSWPGLGRYAVTAVSYLDFPAIMGVTVILSCLFICFNLIVDILYYALDPRIHY